MRNILLCALSICAFLAFASGQSRPVQRDLKEITLSGTGYQRGLQHGRQLRTEIAAIVQAWKTNTGHAIKKDPDQVLKDFFEYAHFTEAIQKWTPDLRNERERYWR